MPSAERNRVLVASPNVRAPLTYLRTLVFICGSIFFASPLVSDDDQGLTARGPPRQEARLSTANERKWAGDRAGTERRTAFPAADCWTQCCIHVERQSRALNSPGTRSSFLVTP
jgi:hypothetical protein